MMSQDSNNVIVTFCKKQHIRNHLWISLPPFGPTLECFSNKSLRLWWTHSTLCVPEWSYKNFDATLLKMKEKSENTYLSNKLQKSSCLVFQISVQFFAYTKYTRLKWMMYGTIIPTFAKCRSRVWFY